MTVYVDPFKNPYLNHYYHFIIDDINNGKPEIDLSDCNLTDENII